MERGGETLQEKNKRLRGNRNNRVTMEGRGINSNWNIKNGNNNNSNIYL